MESVANLFRMIKFSHTLFALPFALMGAVLAERGIPPMGKIFWILVAMAAARTAAMTFNRIADRSYDAMNPRTADRELPRGAVSRNQAIALLVVSVIVFEWASYSLNSLCLKLSPVALLIILGYSYTKRFTRYSHLVLGLGLAMAPVGAWIAVRGSLNLPVLLLGLAVLFWVAGFDILYAIQDIDFDQKVGLHSIPRFFGIRYSLWLSRIFHLLTFVILALEILLLKLGGYYIAGLLLVGLLLIYEHSIIREDDLSQLNTAFFNMNGYISITVFTFTLVDLLL
jgi:4-hydroxybenzoate polyprenyltransferase